MRSSIIAATVLIVSVGLAQAGIRADLSGDAVVDFATTMDMPFMTVGNPGNAGQLSGEESVDRICGAVSYEYNIGKFEVTAGQYTEFLNAVAATDTYELYNTSMWSSGYGCKIERTGSPGSYTYSVAADWEDRPANYINWGDAARFANWLTNGMPTGAQDLTTTEDGSYFLNGVTSESGLLAVTRKSWQDGGRYYIPTEDEWYKPAYHKNDGITGNYFDYPTRSDTVPGHIGDGESITDPDPGNYVTYDGDGGIDGIGSPYYRTEVGEHENSESPYGAFDMGGNAWEWNEAVVVLTYRGMRGGAYNIYGDYGMHASGRTFHYPATDNGAIGFRISEIPEPAALSLLALGGLALLRRK